MAVDVSSDKDRLPLLQNCHLSHVDNPIFAQGLRGTKFALATTENFLKGMRTSRIALAVQQLTGMFVQEPERQLSLAEAARLTGLDVPSCQIVLETLQDARFLTRAGDGRFARTDRAQSSPG